MSGGRAHKVIERKHAAAAELNETGLETLGAPILEIDLDRLDMALEVVHMAVRRLLAVRLCHRFRLSGLVGRTWHGPDALFNRHPRRHYSMASTR